MKKNRKQVYILYKTIKNENDEIIDIEYLQEYNTQKEITKDIKASYRDIVAMVNTNFLKDIKTFKNYCIIKEDY